MSPTSQRFDFEFRAATGFGPVPPHPRLPLLLMWVSFLTVLINFFAFSRSKNHLFQLIKVFIKLLTSLRENKRPTVFSDILILPDTDALMSRFNRGTH